MYQIVEVKNNKKTINKRLNDSNHLIFYLEAPLRRGELRKTNRANKRIAITINIYAVAAFPKNFSIVGKEFIFIPSLF